MSSLSKKAGYLIFARVMEFAVTFFIPIVTVRALSVADFALWKQFQLLFGTLLPFAGLGLPEGILYFYSREPEKRKETVWYSFFLFVASGIIVFSLILIFSHQITLLINNPRIDQCMLLLAFSVLLFLSSSLLESTLISADRVKFATWVITFLAACKAAFIIIATLLWHNVYLVIISFFCWVVVRFIFTLFYLLKNYNIFAVKIDFGYIKQIFKYSIPLGMSVVPFIISANLHNYLVSLFYSPQTFAIYSVGAMVELPLMGFITDGVWKVIRPRFSVFQREGSTDLMGQIYSEAIRKLSLIFFPIFVFVFVCSREVIVFMFSDKYAGSAPIFRIYSWVIPLCIFEFTVFFKTYARTGFLLKMHVIVAFLLAPFLYIAAKYFNIYAVAFVSVLGGVGYYLYMLIKVRKLLMLSVQEFIPVKHLLRLMAVCLLLGVSLLCFKTFVVSKSVFANLSLYACLFFSVYIFIAFKTGMVLETEKQALVNKWNAIKSFLEINFFRKNS